MGFWKLAISLAALVSSLLFAAETLTPFLSPSDLDHLRQLVEKRTGNLEALEMEYHQTVQRQVFTDLIALYSPENAARVQVTYATFTPDNARDALGDLGYGLHVVRRLTLPLSEGRTKVVEVNEQWLQNPVDGGLFLPDEIRVKTLAYEGPRRVAGSEKLYLFDQLRVGWDEYDKPHLSRRTRFNYDKAHGRNLVKQMRVPVSSPLSCVGCHHADTRRAERFLAPGEARNQEAIVQDSYFKKPLAETLGLREYLAELSRQKRSPELVAKAKQALLEPAKSLELPHIVEALTAARDQGMFDWLGTDTSTDERARFEVQNRRGMYEVRDTKNQTSLLYRDAVEDTVEGTYLWWTPVSVIPPHAY